MCLNIQLHKWQSALNLLPVQIEISKIHGHRRDSSVLGGVHSVAETALCANSNHPFLPNYGPGSTGEGTLMDRSVSTLHPHNNCRL